MNNEQPAHDPVDRAEYAYRRGYHQGVAAVAEAQWTGATIEDIEQFEDAVCEWRNGQDIFAAPPLVFDHRRGQR